MAKVSTALSLLTTVVLGAGSVHAQLLPDLQIDYLALDADNELSLRISNQGEAAVPAGVGWLRVFVDERRVVDLALSDLADQSFLSIGGETSIATGLRIAGSGRRVAAFVDSDDEIAEQVELQNTVSVTLDAAPLSGVDLVIEAEVDPSDLLFLRVTNAGDVASADPLPIDCLITGSASRQWAFQHSLPSVAAGGVAEVIVYPPDPVFLPSPTDVAVLCSAPSAASELDHSNNFFEGQLWHLDATDIDPLYAPLLNNPAISSSLYFDAPYYATYASWPQSMKDELAQDLLLLEQRKRLPVTEPPPLVLIEEGIHAGNDWDYFLSEDAISIYLAYVAHSLWLERNATLPWSLLSLSADELSNLFDARQFMQAVISNPFNQLPPELSPLYTFSSQVMGNATAWNPRVMYGFMENLGLLGATAEETVFALGGWMRGHARHTLSGETILANRVANFGYKGIVPADKIPYPLAGKDHATWGCWGTSGVWGAFMRAVNIPTVHGRTDLSGGLGWPCGTHSRIEFPTLKKNPGDTPGLGVMHSDDFYNLYHRPHGFPVIETFEYFFNGDELAELIDDPAELDGTDDVPPVYNSVCDQGSYNGRLTHHLLAIPDPTGPYLYRYAVYGASALEDELTGDFAQPLLDPIERAAFLADIDAKIVAYGGGTWIIGRNYVVAQQNRFSNAQHPNLGVPTGENRAPTLDWVPSQYVAAGETVDFLLTASDSDLDPLTWSLVGPPPSATLVGNHFTWDVGTTEGIQTLRIAVTDSQGGVAMRTIQVSIAAGAPPVPALSATALAISALLLVAATLAAQRRRAA